MVSKHHRKSMKLFDTNHNSARRMKHYLYKKLVHALFTLAGVIVLLFFIFSVLPADPARMILGQRADSVSIAIINKDLGYNESLPVQLLKYVNDLSPISFCNSKNESSAFYLDRKKYNVAFTLLPSSFERNIVVKAPYLRRSYQTKKSVSQMISEKLPDTTVLAFAAILFASLFGIFFGVIASLKKGAWLDKLLMAVSVIGVSMPSFFMAILFAWLFGFVLSQYTGLNMTGGLYSLEAFKGEYLNLKNLILPAFVLGIRPLSIIFQLTRSSMLETLSMDFVRTARAKGLGKNAILYRHALRNAVNPVITAVSGWLGSLLAGAVFIEFIFGWNGLGKMTVTALENYDLPVVMGTVLFITIIFITVNILADIAYTLSNPAIKLK